jgi:glycopeptide antibiotics resistance protein
MTAATATTAVRTLASILLVLYLVVLAALTLRPASEDTNQSLRVNLRPFATIGPALRLGPGSFSYGVLVGNFVAFLPLGMLVPLVRRRSSWLAVVLIGFGLSTAIELTQLAISLAVGYGYRSADIDDVIVNTSGTAVGLAAVVIVGTSVRTLARGR